MDLNSVLKAMEDGQTKTAAENTPVATAEAGALASALEKAAQAIPSRDGGNPVDALMNMAENLAGAEKEAEVAFAAVCGQAFADAAISKFAAYDAQAQIVRAQAPRQGKEAGMSNEELAKIAAEGGYNAAMRVATQGSQEKMAAAEENELVKLAATKGYEDTMEKAAADYQAGQQEALNEVHAVAYGEFLKGAAEAEVTLNGLRAQQAR
jgi:hypothetical protein